VLSSIALILNKEGIFFLVFGVRCMAGDTEHRPFFKKNSTFDIKTTYVISDIGSRIIHTPSCEKKITEKLFLSIFK
jgi:hypothetical protein